MRDISGIDYYTCTTKSRMSGNWYFDLWHTHKVRALEHGHKVKAFNRNGYACLYIRGLTVGVRQGEEYIITSSGPIAAKTWSRVFPRASRITRVDLQYTFLSPSYIDLREVEAEWEAVKSKNGKGKIIHNTEGGQCLYIGSRQSNQFGRFYNKSEEAGLEVKNIYRLEVELKKPRADAVISELTTDFGGLQLKPQAVRDYVLSWFERRKIALGIDFKVMPPVQLTKVATTDSRKLIWLRSAVAPSLADLMARKKGPLVAKALNLKTEDYEQLAMFSKQENFEKMKLVDELKKLGDKINALE